jgi:hypothetical protein
VRDTRGAGVTFLPEDKSIQFRSWISPMVVFSTPPGVMFDIHLKQVLRWHNFAPACIVNLHRFSNVIGAEKETES